MPGVGFYGPESFIFIIDDDFIRIGFKDVRVNGKGPCNRVGDDIVYF